HTPSLAFSLPTLELYRRIRLRKPSFSVEAFAKVLCDLYGIPYRRRCRSALADAFDVYLMILRNVDREVSEALGRSSADWRVQNSCPACTYELEGEPDLKYHRMLAFDGNNSLSRAASLGGRSVGDNRVFKSDYFLDPDYVNVFADEVGTSSTAPGDAVTADDVTSPDNPEDVMSGCTKNFKAAASDSKKKAWGIFEETGIFACACRHGIILWIADMIRSGELFKYPLSIVNKAVDTLGPRLLIGYDVGCKLAITIEESSIAGKFRQSQSRMCVDAFHGYTHKYICQDTNHPNVIEGMGLEDLSTMERIFSSSNQLASVTRYASAYNRRVYIDQYFRQWDEDKYLNLGYMLYRNYIQALDIIEMESVALQEAKVSLNIGDGDLETWLAEQSAYLATLGHETEWDVHAVTYVELLQKLMSARATAEGASNMFLSTTPSDYQFIVPGAQTFIHAQYADELSYTRKLETQRRVASERYDQLLLEVTEMEVKMGLSCRWQPSDPEYAETVKYIATRKFHNALDNLQRLVVMRLMELHKLNISRTGYKMRSHIAKALQTRCKAIKSALKVYNDAAHALSPPAPTLEWERVSHYAFLEEFTLLRETRVDIRSKRWAEPAVREAMKQSLRIKRAQEEIIRCNIEIRRIQTAIHDEEKHFDQVIDRLKASDSHLMGPINEFCNRRRRINAHVMARIAQTFELPGFTGDKSNGNRLGTASTPSTIDTGNDTQMTPIVSDEHARIEMDDQVESDTIDSDEAVDEIEGLVDYISTITV
ncbi:hypothetical protein BJ138DRAFT_1239965, partial [Hygrophoropsis aurantiaca]